MPLSPRPAGDRMTQIHGWLLPEAVMAGPCVPSQAGAVLLATPLQGAPAVVPSAKETVLAGVGIPVGVGGAGACP